MEKISNALRHIIDIDNAKANIKIEISLDDDCKNGHQDFSMTATYWEIGKRRSERSCIGGGCCHEEILKVRPDLKPFERLHLADYTGCPMYAVENGFYHMKNGYFDQTKPLKPETFKAEFCEYFRVTPEQFDALKMCKNQMRFAIQIKRLGILDQWKAEADAAIKQLEDWTGTKFLVDSKRTQFTGWTMEEEATEEEREKSGYYLPANVEAREKEERAEVQRKQYAEIEAERNKEIEKARLEYRAKKAVLDAGLSLENFIFYNHTQTGAFNWRGYGVILSDDDFAAFLASEHSKLEGVKWTNKEKV